MSLTKKRTVSCVREKVARGFGLSGTDHWGKTKAAIRSMLLPEKGYGACMQAHCGACAGNDIF
ncbi:hypothetical protein GVN18_20795 [Pseudomonas sp. ODNR1LW]|nr:hypothetical protein [Pseudomonas sp. ODNR1LW]